jgi:hypothetical protein
LPDDLVAVEEAALVALKETPCANDAELLQKMRYLVAYEKYCRNGRPFEMFEGEAIAIALDIHFQTGASS